MVIQVNHPQLGIREFPDDTPESEMKAAIRQELSFGAQQPGPLGAFGIGAGHGALRAGQGLKQLGLLAGEKLGVVPRGTLSNYSQGVDSEEALYQATPVGGGLPGTLGDFVGQAAPFVAGGIATGGASLIPAGARAAYPVASRVLGSVGAGAATGAASYVPENASRAEGALLGGAFGPIGEYGASKLGQGVNKLFNARAGNFTDPNVGKLLQQSEAAGIPLHAQNVLDNVALQRTAQGLENLPVGQASAVNRQADKAINVIEEKQAAALKDLVNTRFGGAQSIDKIEKAALDPVNPYHGAAKQLASLVPPDDDIRGIVNTSLRTQLLKNKIDAAAKFNKVEKLSGDSPFQLGGAIQTLGDIKSKIVSELPIPNEKLNNQLESITAAIKEPLSFTQARGLRSQIGDMINGYYKGDNSIIGAQGVGYLQAVKNAIDKDLETFATGEAAAPELKAAWKEANEFYKNKVIPYKGGAIARSLRSADPDAVYKAFVKNGQGEGIPKQFYNALEEKGRAAVRAGIYTDALTAATDAGGNISPAKFATQLSRKQDLIKTFFPKDKLQEIQGLQNVLGSLGGRIGRSPATGVQVREVGQLAGVAAAGYLNFPLTASLLTSAAGVSKLLTHPAGVRFLAASSKLPPGSPKLEMLLKQFEKTAGTIAAQRGQKAGTK